MQQSIVKTEIKECSADFNRHKSITWSAVITGALIAFGLTFLFNLLLMGIGLAVYATGNEGTPELALYGFLITLIGGFILLFIAGWKTGKLIKYCPSADEMAMSANAQYSKHKHCVCYHGMAHGFLAWVIYLIISLLFFSFIAQSDSLSFMKSTHLEFVKKEEVARSHTTTKNTSEAAVDSPSTKILAETVTAQIIAAFLIFLFGALGCSLGSYLGLLSKKKHYLYASTHDLKGGNV